MSIPIRFVYLTGVKREIFRHVRLTGSWDLGGRYSEGWTDLQMAVSTGEDGCPCFTATVQFDDSQVGREFHWGVFVEGPAGISLWGIPTELADPNDRDRYRTFVLRETTGPNTPQEGRYYLTHCRRLGANKCYLGGESGLGIRFAVWAPNAEEVKVVFGSKQTGYIADDGTGIHPDFPPISLSRGKDGVWESEILPDFSEYDHRPYMFRITKEGGQIAYRTDLYSRCQIGSGKFDPQGGHFSGKRTELDGTKSCSVVIDPDTVAKRFKEDVWPEHEFIPAEEFWRNEFSPNKPLPDRVEDLVIYELHVGALGFGKERPGNFEDAIELLDYLTDLGVNAVELLPIAEFEGWAQWGYGSSHYFAFEYSAGGRDQLKHFIRECHRRGMAVIVDVVYNHYHHHAERAQWAYDSDNPEHNIYYWYEGRVSDYPNADGGYVDNMSTGYAPCYWEEMVRQMFISSAAALVEDLHIDGFRVDQTTSIHQYNVLHANGNPVGNANIFGAKFLREFSRTLKLIRPKVILIAEDHSDWEMVTEPPDTGGLGFDATWYADFYHHLSGDTDKGPQYAKLIRTAGYGENQPLAMDYFAGTLGWSGHKKVVYHESHDEAGNSKYSKRTIVAAVNSADLFGETRRFAEARCRFAFGMAMLSAGAPLFLMGEEVGAQKDYRYNDFTENREDLFGQRRGDGTLLFRFYQDIIRFRLKHPGLRSHNIDILHINNLNRVIAFRRWGENEEFLVVASLGNYPFASGYTIENFWFGDGRWQEVFNSDSEFYGGNNVGNFGAVIPSSFGWITVMVPANGFVVLQKE